MKLKNFYKTISRINASVADKAGQVAVWSAIVSAGALVISGITGGAADFFGKKYKNSKK